VLDGKLVISVDGALSFDALQMRLHPPMATSSGYGESTFAVVMEFATEIRICVLVRKLVCGTAAQDSPWFSEPSVAGPIKPPQGLGSRPAALAAARLGLDARPPRAARPEKDGAAENQLGSAMVFGGSQSKRGTIGPVEPDK
jgi:hypothetical protein